MVDNSLTRTFIELGFKEEANGLVFTKGNKRLFLDWGFFKFGSYGVFERKMEECGLKEEILKLFYEYEKNKISRWNKTT